MKMVVTHGIEVWSALPSGAAQHLLGGPEVGLVSISDITPSRVSTSVVVYTGAHVRCE